MRAGKIALKKQPSDCFVWLAMKTMQDNPRWKPICNARQSNFDTFYSSHCIASQWPIRICWVLQLLQDHAQAKRDESGNRALMEKGLSDFYFDSVDTTVFDVKNRKSLPEATMKKYEKAYALDGDPEVFDDFIGHCKIYVRDLGTNMKNRESDKLLSYTVNLNPALRELISSIAAHREEENLIEQRMKMRYRRQSVGQTASTNGRKNSGGGKANDDERKGGGSEIKGPQEAEVNKDAEAEAVKGAAKAEVVEEVAKAEVVKEAAEVEVSKEAEAELSKEAESGVSKDAEAEVSKEGEVRVIEDGPQAISRLSSALQELSEAVE